MQRSLTITPSPRAPSKDASSVRALVARWRTRPSSFLTKQDHGTKKHGGRLKLITVHEKRAERGNGRASRVNQQKRVSNTDCVANDANRKVCESGMCASTDRSPSRTHAAQTRVQTAIILVIPLHSCIACCAHGEPKHHIV